MNFDQDVNNYIF